MNDTDAEGFGTIRPVLEQEQDKEWGNNVMFGVKEGGTTYQDYLQCDPFTDDGLKTIALYNGYFEEWREEVSKMSSDTSMVEKRWKNWVLYAKNRDKRSIHLDALEGGHRSLAAQQVTLCTDIDLWHSSVPGPGTMTPPKFKQAGLAPKINAAPLTGDMIEAACYEATDKRSSDLKFFNKLISVKVRYFNDFVTPVKDCLKACRVTSEAIAKAKRNAATKDPLTEIGMLIKDFLGKFSHEGLLHTPDLTRHCLTKTNKLPVNVAKTSIKDTDCYRIGEYNRDALEEAVPLCEVLYSDAFERYCENPFSTANELAFFKMFQSPIWTVAKGVEGEQAYTSDKRTRVEPPFLVTYESIAIVPSLPTKKRMATTEMVNKWCLVPKVMHILWGGRSRKTRQETVTDDILTQLVKYTMRHHVYKFGAGNVIPQQVMEFGYNNIRESANLGAGQNTSVALAALYITEIVNSALINVAPTKSTKIGDRKENLKCQTDSISELLSSMTFHAGFLSMTVIINALGKINLLLKRNSSQKWNLTFSLLSLSQNVHL